MQTLSDSTENVLKIPIIFLDLRLHESSENCFKLPRTVWDFRELFKNSENCLELPKTAWDFRGLFETCENCLKLPKTVWNFEKCLKIPRTVWDFRELFETSENCLKIPTTVWDSENCLKLLRTVWDFPELSKNFLKLFNTSKNYVRFWEHFTKNHGREQWPFRAIVVFTLWCCYQKCIQNPAKHLIWSFFRKKLTAWSCYFCEKLYFRYFTGSWILFWMVRYYSLAFLKNK